MKEITIKVQQIFEMLKQHDEMVADYLGAPRRSDKALYLEAIDTAKRINR